MTADDQLKQDALSIAHDVAMQAYPLERRLEELNREKAQIERDLELAATREKRVHSYRPEIDGEKQCPRCWVRNERSVSLNNPPSVNDQDIYRCPSCIFELMVDP